MTVRPRCRWPGLGILLAATAMHTGRPARNHLPRAGARPRHRVRSLG
jgi:hypothetical protein